MGEISEDDRRRGGYVPMVEVRRGGIAESLHYGAIAVVDSNDRLLASAGDPECVTFIRSAGKPAQILPLLGSGAVERFGFEPGHLAVMMGSHGGEPFHLAAVGEILSRIGLNESALRCGTHEPLHRATAMALRAAGRKPTVLHNNCSGKHAGMLALAVQRGESIESYLDPSRPLQVDIRRVIERLSGLAQSGVSTALDGCSAPTFAMSLRSAALLYARLIAPHDDARELEPAIRRGLEAMRARPEMIGGTDRLESDLMREGRLGLIAKIGAEGLFALGFEREGKGVGIVLKISDGDMHRARDCATLECLRQLGVLSPETSAALSTRYSQPIVNHNGRPVGELAPCFQLSSG
ncbi:MAG TPA: asparaginase [Candidatus Polarisedimenticolia bacterium]|nr:asparaginase [Candidatus Polarisedimenticolia bacterium]